MRSLVVLFAVVAVVVAAPHHEKRSLGHVVAYSVPSAVSHSSRVDVRSSPAVVAPVPVTSFVHEPVVAARTVVAPAVYTAGAVSHQSRVDVKTSPAVVAHLPVVASAPVVAEPVVVDARSVYSVPSASLYSVPAATVYSGGSAVTHQSRVDVHSSPAVVTQEVVAPAVVEARSVVVPSVYSSW